MTLLDAGALQNFYGVVEHTIGLDLQSQRVDDIARILRQQSSLAHLSASAYVELLTQGASDEWALLTNRLTVGETYFFRHEEQLQGCCRLIQRSCMAVGCARRVRVLCAGCSTGEEPYSLAMMLDEWGIDRKAVEIVAMDVNPAAIQRARLGVYTEWALRETEDWRVARSFQAERGTFRLNQGIRDSVRFVEANLVAPAFGLFADYDVVLCRNVLMYFSPHKFQQAATTLVQALRPGGALFLGHAESLRGNPLNVESVHEFGIFYYRSCPVPEAKAVLRAPEPVGFAAAEPLQLRSHDANRAARIIDDEDVRGDEPLADLASVEELMRAERFQEALQSFQAMRARVDWTTGLRLRYAMLLILCNEFRDAVGLLDALLGEDSVAAEVHYARALCHERADNPQRALYHHGLAAHLDPIFALPWLHRGMLHKRLGDKAVARKELLQARALLSAEAPERVLWFGGGSSRANLLDVCQNGLDAGGER